MAKYRATYLEPELLAQIRQAVRSEMQRAKVERGSGRGDVVPPMATGWCRFTLDSALAETDADVQATIDITSGIVVTGTITVKNAPDAASGNYQFSGSSGAYGYALYRYEDQSWYMIQLNCP